jgi:beta-phosphoglucomutase-like phosphatase (HAD superfamily)
MKHIPVHAVIFDFNGTLFLDNDKHVKAWSAISEILRNKPLSEEELHSKINGKPNHMIIRYLSNNQASPEQEAYYSRKKEEIYRALCAKDTPNFHLIAGAYEAFQSLKEHNIPFTIASASIKENIDFFVESFDLDRYIDPKNICYDNGKYPDKTQMLLDACRILYTKPENVTIIEDSLSGLNSAKQAGIQDIRIINSAKTPELFKEHAQVSEIGETMQDIHFDYSS